jgi:hypothetical protein
VSAAAVGVGGGTVPESAIELSSGTSLLVELFVADAGIYLVLDDEVRLVDRMGEAVASWTAGATIVAAAFGEERLGVTTSDTLHLLDEGVVPLGSGPLGRLCRSPAIVGGPTLVCSPTYAADAFDSFDATTAAHLATTANQYWVDDNDPPLLRVPGTDDLLVLDGRFYLFLVDPAGLVSFVDGSPSGVGVGNGALAFDGLPATHVVNHQGEVLEIYASTCQPGANGGCFVKVGAVDVFTGEQRFVGMDDAGSGVFVGLVELIPAVGSGPLCDGGCLVRKVDMASETVVSQTAFLEVIGELVATRYDPVLDAVVVGYNLPKPGANDPFPGHRVLVVPLR